MSYRKCTKHEPSALMSAMSQVPLCRHCNKPMPNAIRKTNIGDAIKAHIEKLHAIK